MTDVEGSTPLWERRRDVMGRALQLHDALIGAAVEDAGGRVVRARGEGDSLFAVFDRPTDAVRAALAARRALQSADWPGGVRLEVRFAIHMGEVEARDGDYYGAAVNRAARIRSLAVGGQILISQAVAEVVLDHLPDEASLVELGEHQLRGLSRPERIRAVVDTARPVREAIGGLCPYKGLLAYQADDEEIFFGREAQSANVLGRLLERHLVVVIGASGSGKSSLVRAGVLAALRRGEVPGSDMWSLVIMTPGENPTSAFAEGMAQVEGRAGPRVVVVVDQMEELFTACRNPLERARFVDALLDALTTRAGSLMVVGALRADFYGHCATLPRLATALSDASVLLGAMDERELRRAIEGPAEVAGLQLEPGLVDVILRDLAREPGSLPLLSHALLETWQRREARTMTLAGYHDSGGVRGAIAHTAEVVWTETLREQERPLARSIFLRLTELGEGTEDTRRRVAHTELTSGPNGADIDDVLSLLADRRLITVDDGTVEVAHEALVREWPRLRGWLDDDRESLRAHRHLTHAAEDWNGLGRDPAELYRGPRLQTTREWLSRDSTVELNDLETAFVGASEEQERAALAAEQEHSAARERSNRRLRNLFVATAIALVVALGAGAIAIAQRSSARREAQHARAVSVSAEVDRAVAEVPLLLERDRSLALLLAVQAQRTRPDATTGSALFTTLVAEPRLRFTLWGGHGGYAWLALFPDGTRVAALGRDGADVWDLETRKKLGSFDVPDASGISVSPDGGLIAAGSRTGTVTFWDSDTLHPVGASLDAGAPVTDVEFMPDGQRLAVAVGTIKSSKPTTAATTAQLWEVGSRARSGITLGGHALSVNAFALSPDGRVLAAGDNEGQITFHDPSTGVAVGPAVQLDHSEGVLQLTFSPDGRWLGIGTFGRDGLGGGHVVDVGARHEVAQVGTGTIVYVGFTPDNKQFVTASETVDTWDTDTWQRSTGEPIKTQHGPAQVMNVGASSLVLSGFDGTLSVWDPSGTPTIARVLPDASPAGGVFSPDGAYLAIVSHDDTMTLYRTDGLRRIETLSISGAEPRGALDGPTPVAFSPDSRMVAIGDRFGNVQLFDTRSRQEIGQPISADTKPVVALTFNPRGDRLIATSNSDTVNGAKVIDIATRRVKALDPPVPYALTATFRADGKVLIVTSGVGGAMRYPVSDRTIGHGTKVTLEGALPESAAFSPAGELLAIGRTDGTVLFLDANTMELRGSSVPISAGLLASISWSTDGRFIVAQDISGDHALVDVDQRERIGDRFPGIAPTVFGHADFAPDGKTMVLPGPRGTTIWNLDVTKWPATACTIVGRNLTQIEWNTYFSSTGDYRPTCPH